MTRRVYAASAGDGLIKVGSSRHHPGFRITQLRRRGKLTIIFMTPPHERAEEIERTALVRATVLPGRELKVEHSVKRWVRVMADA